MPVAVDVTPAFFSNSWSYNEAFDTPLARYGAIQATTTSTQVSVTYSTVGQGLFGIPFVQKTAYTAQAQTVTTVTVSTAFGSANYTLTVSKVFASVPTLLVSMTQYHTVVPTNTTVWSSLDSSSSLLATAGQNDLVSYKVAVVSDSTV